MMNAGIPPADPTRILVVDDEAAVADVLSDTLVQENYEVLTRYNAQDALQLVRNQQFAVIISDQRMPQQTGLEFFKQVKLIQPNTSRILLTGVTDLNVMIEAINQGEIYRFMVKPWLREELLTTIKNAIHRFELICSNAALQNTTRLMNLQLTEMNHSLEEQMKLVEAQNSQLERLNRALGENLAGSVELCVKTMQMFYPTLGTHAQRVHAICKAMADNLRLSNAQRQVLEISGQLHDIGLVGVQRQLIRRWFEKPKALSKPERELVQQHPILGQELANFGHHLKDVGILIRAHHEHFDGSGFPDGLAGEEIPWLGRLLSVAIGYVEPGTGNRDKVREIQSRAGTEFDPEAVRVLTRCLPQAVLPQGERPVLLAELEPGMVLAKGIYNANGLLILPEGQQLSEVWIDKLQAHNRVSPITQALLVYG